MRIRLESDARFEQYANIVVFVSEEGGLETAGRELPPAERFAALRALGDFRGKRGATCLLYAPRGEGEPDQRWLFAGLGGAAQRGPRAWRAAAAAAQCALAELGAESALVVLPAAPDLGEVAAGLLLSGYKFDRFLKNGDARAKRLGEAVLLLPPGADAASARAALLRAERHAAGVALARELMNGPANTVTPSALAEAAQQIAADSGGAVTCSVLGEPELAAENCRAILAVGAGSAEPSRLVVLDYAPAGATQTVVFVGKGVTFDSGGISIKPAADMHEMKWDMGGAAAVLGVFRALAGSGLALRIVGLVPAVENMPSGTAYRPGDIVVARSGLSIEVKNTDAEGRIILADALDYAKQYAPDLLIDLATLTGACVVALAHEAAGLMANARGEAFADALCASGERVGERLWPLPLWDEYDELIKSDCADVCNTGGRHGGAIAAGKFLQRFADHAPWIHLDIAGTAWTGKERDITPKVGNGFGVRLLLDFLEGGLGR